MAEQNIPQEFICPITQDLMTNPVICHDGITYEDIAIRQWLVSHTTSPVTREPLSAFELIPNRALKFAIEEYVKRSQPHQSTISVTRSIEKIILNTSLTHYKKNNKIYYNVKIKSQGPRKNVSLIVLIDVSGSMGQAVSESIGGESDGFSRLDLIKHTMKTIIESLTDNDELCIIKFNNIAQIVCNFVKMTQINKIDVNRKITELYADGQTNIWDALRLAFDKIKSIDVNSRVGSIFLLTDGESNVNPPRGIVETLKSTYDFTSLPYTVNTFGYSYNVDSSLLYQISNLCGGIYGFIPDGTMVGTIFINAISNLLTSVSSSCKIKVDSPNSKLLTQSNLGFMPNNQEKNILLEYDISTIGANNLGNIYIKLDSETYCIPLNIDSSIINSNVVSTICRIMFIHSAKSINTEFNNKVFTDLTNDIKSFREQTPYITSLLSDLENDDPNHGQLKKSIKHNQWYQKWGRHYLPSAIRSHELELCFNFKDAAPQHYVSDVFKAEQTRIESLFCTISPPRPSLHTTVQTTNMTSYYNRDGGCFDGNGKVLLPDNSTKLVKNIRKGDLIMTPNGPSTVKCVLKLKFDKLMKIININGLLVTQFHPVFYNNTWFFPIDIAESNDVYIDELYDFVLDSNHIAIINDIHVVCLGHQFTDDIVYHEYFGKKIISDLETHPNWNDGYINLRNYSFLRDPDTNQVINLSYSI